MSKMAELAYDIETLFIDGCSPADIAEQLNIPVSMVKSTLKTFGVDVRDMEQDLGDYYGA
jgi:DNA-directed RNA polymerase specialized sigma24 family protein